MCKIGEMVRMRDYESIPEDKRNKGNARLCGKKGRVVDIVSSVRDGEYYIIRFEGSHTDSTIKATKDMFTRVGEFDELSYNVEINDDNVVVSMCNGGGENRKKSEGVHLYERRGRRCTGGELRCKAYMERL